MSKRAIWLAIFALIAVASALRLPIMIDRPLWDDELWHRAIVRETSYAQIFTWTYNELHPPACFLANRLTLDLTGSDAPWAWRLPCLIAGLLCIPAAFWLGKTIGSTALGLGAAVMLAVDLNVSWESQNARMYSTFALLLLVALTVAVPLLRQPAQPPWRWALLGALLAALLWTHLLAPLIWVAVAIASGVALARKSTPDFSRRALIIGLLIAFAVAGVLGLPGIQRFFEVRRGLDGVAVPDRSFGEIGRTIYWLVNLLVWIPVRFATPLALAFSAAGCVFLARRHRAAGTLVIALAALTLLSQVQVLRANPYSVMRYFIPFQPVLWLGLPFLLLCVLPRGLGTALFAVYAGAQTWNCAHLERNFGSISVNVRESRAFAQAASRIRENRAPGDAVTYLPFERFAYRGEYYGLPAHPALGPGPATVPTFPRPTQKPVERPFVPAQIDAPAVWMLARLGGDASELRSIAESLATLYRAPFDDAAFTAATQPEQWLLVHASAKGVRYESFPLR